MPVFSRSKKKKGYADMDDDDGGSSAEMEFVPIHLSKTVPMKDSAEKERQKAALKAKEKKMRSRMKKHKVKMDAERDQIRQAFEGNVTSQLEMYASSKTGSHLMDMSANHDNLETCENLLDESESLFNDCDDETGREPEVVADDENFASQINSIKAKQETAKQKERDAFLAAKKKKEEKKKRKKEKENKEKSSSSKDKKEKTSSSSSKDKTADKKSKEKDKAEREKARVDHKANFKQREKEHKEHLKRKKAAEKERKKKAKEEKALDKERKKIEKMAASSEMADGSGSNNDSSGSSRKLLGGRVASTRRLFGRQLSGKKLSRRFSNGLGLFKKTGGGGGGTTTTAAEEFQEQESIRTRNGFKPRSDVTNLWGVENTKKY